MTMQSSNLLPALQDLPGDESGEHWSFRDHITNIVNMDRAMYAAEFASAVSFGTWFLFDERSIIGIRVPGMGINVEDDLGETMTKAHEMAFDYDGSLAEHWQETVESGPASVDGFIGILKGKTAEIKLTESLRQNGFTDLKSGADTTQQVWEVSTVGPDGQEVFLQAGTGVDAQSQFVDTVTEGYRKAFPNETRTWWEHHQDALNNPRTYDNTFMSPLKGKVAEIDAKELLDQQEGVARVDFPQTAEGGHDLTREGIDLYATMDDGQVVHWQVKTGTSDSQIRETLDALQSDPGLHGAVSEEIHGGILKSDRTLIDRLMDIGSGEKLEQGIQHHANMMLSMGDMSLHAINSEAYDAMSEPTADAVNQLIDTIPDYELVSGTGDGLSAISENMGIDVPERVADIIPYAVPIMAGARLVYSIIKTEKEFKAADRTTKNKIQVVQSLTVMSRFGVTFALASAGGVGGTALGSVVPGVGNLIGGIAGLIGGGVMGSYLNRHLQPHMLNLALNITGLTNDDLFYYKNKPRVDTAALSLQATARELAAAPCIMVRVFALLLLSGSINMVVNMPKARSR